MKDIAELLVTTSDRNPIKRSQVSATVYLPELVDLLRDLAAEITDHDIDDILVNKLQLSKATFDPEAYWESATELSVIHKMATIPHNSFRYEKPVREDTKKNPECTVASEPYTINVEAKCPRIPNVEKVSPQGKQVLVMKSAGRVPGFFDEFDLLKSTIESSNAKVEMVVGKNKDNTLKDFLQSAHDKFPDLRDNNELNVLFVSLDDVHNIQEWWYYLFEHEGLFTLKPFVDPRTYSRVDVVIFSNLMFRHKYNENVVGSAWSLDDSFNLFMSNGHRQGPKEQAHRFLSKFIQNHTEETKMYRVPGDADESVLEALRVTGFVRDELEKKRKRYYFLRETREGST